MKIKKTKAKRKTGRRKKDEPIDYGPPLDDKELEKDFRDWTVLPKEDHVTTATTAAMLEGLPSESAITIQLTKNRISRKALVECLRVLKNLPTAKLVFIEQKTKE